MTRKKRWKSIGKNGLFFGIMAAISFGMMNVIVKIGADELPATEVAFARGLIGAMILGPWLLDKFPVLLQPRGRILWFRSLAGAVSVLCIFINPQNSSVGDASALSNISSLFVVGLSWVFLKERMNAFEWSGVLCVIGGVFLLQSPIGSHLPWSIVGTGVFGAFTASLAYLALRQAAREFSSRLIVWCFCLTTALASLLFPAGVWRLPDLWESFLLILIGVLGLLGQLSMTQAYALLPTAIACALSLSSVLWGVLVESLYLWRLPPLGALTSYLLILAGVFILQTQQKKVQDSESTV